MNSHTDLAGLVISILIIALLLAVMYYGTKGAESRRLRNMQRALAAGVPPGTRWAVPPHAVGRDISPPPFEAAPPLRAGESIRTGAELIVRDGLAYERPASDIWPTRLANLIVWSGLLGDKQSWAGTAGELRAALCSPATSTLNWRNQRELPPADVIEHKLRGMAASRGRLTIIQVGVQDGTVSIWAITPTQEGHAP